MSERIDHAEARELAESLIRNAPRWDENEKPVDPAIHRLWVGYGKRVGRAYLDLLTERTARAVLDTQDAASAAATQKRFTPGRFLNEP